jgi:hypothetical protein
MSSYFVAVWNTDRLFLVSEPSLAVTRDKYILLVPDSKIVCAPFESDLQVVILGDELIDLDKC